MKEAYIHVSNQGSYLTRPISGIIRADLISATFPLDVPNIFDGDQLVIKNVTIPIPQGFWNQLDLLSYINRWAIPDLLAFLRPENNNPQFVSSSPFFLTGSSSNVLAVLGMTSDQSPVLVTDDINPQVSNKWVITGQNVDKLGVKQMFLKIEEFTHPFMNGFFATFPIDKPQGSIMVFNESKYCKCTVIFKKPLDSIHRLTPTWFDNNRNVLSLQGNFLLRVYYKEHGSDSVSLCRL